MRGETSAKIGTVLPWIPVVLSFFFLFRFTEAWRAGLFLLSIAVHEGGHLAAFFFCGAGAPRLSPVPGGFRFRSPSPLSYRAELAVALAGPLSNLVPGLLFLLCGAGNAYLLEAGWIFLGAGASNLIPVSDHDGGRALLCLLSPRLGPARAERIAAVVSLLSLSLSLTLSFSLLYVSGAGFYFTVFCLFSLLSHPL